RTRWQTRPLSRRAKRRSSAAPGSLQKNRPASSIPQTWYTRLLTLLYLGITESWYYYLGGGFSPSKSCRCAGRAFYTFNYALWIFASARTILPWSIISILI